MLLLTYNHVLGRDMAKRVTRARSKRQLSRAQTAYKKKKCIVKLKETGYEYLSFTNQNEKTYKKEKDSIRDTKHEIDSSLNSSGWLESNKIHKEHWKRKSKDIDSEAVSPDSTSQSQVNQLSLQFLKNKIHRTVYNDCIAYTFVSNLLLLFYFF